MFLLFSSIIFNFELFIFYPLGEALLQSISFNIYRFTVTSKFLFLIFLYPSPLIHGKIR